MSSPRRTPGTLRLALQPKLIGLAVFAAAAVLLTATMGVWQLGVYDTRQADERADRADMSTVALSQVLSPGEPFTATANRRPVTAMGRYAPTAQQLWVSGRELDGRAGYWLVAPFVVDDQRGTDGNRERALVVVRGWSADNGELPAATAGRVSLRAVLQPGESAAGGIGAGGIGADRTTATIRIPFLINELPYDLYSGYGIVTAQEPADAAGVGLEPVAPPPVEASWTSGLRNLAYAIQWWVFAAFAGFMWWRMSRDVIAADRAAHMGGRDPARDGSDDDAVGEGWPLHHTHGSEPLT